MAVFSVVRATSTSSASASFALSLPLSRNWLRVSIFGGVLYVVAKVAYRRFLDPLANVPGPFLPAVTRLYAWFYNVPLEGQLHKEIERLHGVYGPIVRIAPDQVHLSDLEHYDVIYGPESTFSGDLGFELALKPFFSRRSVLDIEALVQSKVDKLCRRVSADRTAAQPSNLHAAFRAVSVDVITDYAFDECWHQLEADDLGEWFGSMMRGAAPVMFTVQAFPSWRGLLRRVPEGVVRRISPAVADFLRYQTRARDHVQFIQNQNHLHQGAKPTRLTIFHQLLDPNAYQDGPVPSVDDVVDEAFSMTTAAADLIGDAMTVAASHVVRNPVIYGRLIMELREAFPDPTAELSFVELEKLPYLTGIVKEGQRLSHGFPNRLPRVVPEDGIEMEGHFLPKHTIVSTSSYMLQRNPSVFPNPDYFDPARWTDPTAACERERSLVSFSRHDNLAQCELYVALGTLFRRFEDLRPLGGEDFPAFDSPGQPKFQVTGGGNVEDSFIYL